MLEEVQRYWDSRPCNVRHSDIDIASDPLGYDEEVTERKLFVEPHIGSFMDLARWRNKRVLDLGCGIGTQALMFAQYGAESVIAVDISPESLLVARARRDALRYKNLHFFQGDIENLDGDFFRDNYYDLVFSFGVVHHTPNPRKALEEAYRVLKPLGELRLMVYNRYSWKALWIVLTYGRGKFWKWKELIPAHSEANTGCPVTWTFTRGGIAQLVEDVGFSVESIRVDHIFPYRINDYKEHRYVKEWYWSLCPQRLFRWLERHFGWHIMVVARR